MIGEGIAGYVSHAECLGGVRMPCCNRCGQPFFQPFFLPTPIFLAISLRLAA